MKKVLIIMAMLLPLATFAQKTEDVKKLTKFEEFTSKTGAIIKFVDVNMPRIPVSYASLAVSIRTLYSGASKSYFLRLEKEETSSSNARIAMIEYSDLVEINKALVKLASEVDADLAANPDYMENKFRTVDGFEVGYYITKKEVQWYLKLERYTNSNVYPKSRADIIEYFKDAQTKIEELKASGK